MINIKALAIDRFSKWLIGGELFDFIRRAVMTMVDADVPGPEKREKVFNQVKEFFEDSADFFINTGIELALMYIKYKYGVKTNGK